jgi:DNA-binding response OmpR family regulator
MTTITLVEDNDDLRQLTSRFLNSKGYEVMQAASAEELAELSGLPNVYIVDLNLPETNGYDLIRNLRSISNDVGIVVLSARDRSIDITRGYEAGADVYLTKPVDPNILIAALRRLEARNARTRDGAGVLVIDKLRREIDQDGANIRLSEPEFNLLYQLSIAGERGLERWEVAEVMGMNLDRDVTKALEVRITRLRKKLRAGGAPDYAIEARRGFGYRLRGELRFK